MKLKHLLTALDIDYTVKGNTDIDIYSIASLKGAKEDSISFIVDKKYENDAKNSKAAALFIKKGSELDIPGKIIIEVDDPYLAYAKTALLFEDKNPSFPEGISPNAVIGKNVVLGENVSIGPLTVIADNVIIGSNCIIGAGVVIESGVIIGSNCRIDSNATIRYNCVLKDRVIIQAGSVIGSDGFGNAVEDGKYVRIPCFGNVIIDEGAEIGAGVTIDRGNFEATYIGKGVKTDNLVHIAHNVSVGDNSAIVAQVGISGSTKIGKNVIIAGQAGLVGHIEVGDNAFIAAKAGVSKSVPSGAKVTGYPARDFMTMRRIDALLSKLPEMKKNLDNIKKELDLLKDNIQQSKKGL